MSAFQILFPVIFMIVLGMLCRKAGIISTEQKDGAKDIIFGVVLPFIVFNAMLTSKIDITTVYLVLYTVAGWIVAFIIGFVLRKWVSNRYSEIVPYMMWTVEGGSVALPLYSAVVGEGYAFNTVRFDMAGMVIVFVLIPIMIARKTSGSVSVKELVKTIISNRFIQALMLGLVCKALGLYELMIRFDFVDTYANTINMISAPLTSIILFAIGHEMSFSRSTLVPIAKVMLIRIATSAMIIAGMFVLFKDQMAEKTFLLAVLIYFFSPTGFLNQVQIKPLYRDETDGEFFSTYLSLYMIVTLIAYSIIVTLVA